MDMKPSSSTVVHNKTILRLVYTRASFPLQMFYACGDKCVDNHILL